MNYIRTNWWSAKQDPSFLLSSSDPW